MNGYYDEGAVMRRCEASRLEPPYEDDDEDIPELRRLRGHKARFAYWMKLPVDERINISTRCPRCQVYKPIGTPCAFCPRPGAA